MAATTLPGVLLPAAIHASRPAANAVAGGTLFPCMTHGTIDQSDGVSTWSTWNAAPTAATRASLGLDTTDSPQFAGLNVGAATDTTITRTGAGDIAVEGNALYRAGGSDVPIADGGTGASTKAAAFDALSPMTTQDDLIVGGASGAAARLGKGSDGQVLTVDPTTHHLVWATPASGFANPMTTKGDVIVGDTGGSPIRKAVGSDGQVLTADAASTGGIKWAAGGGGGGGAQIFLQRLTASTSATLDFTSFSSTYQHYLFDFIQLVPDTNSVNFVWRAGTGGTPTYDTGSNYSAVGWYNGVGDSLTGSTQSSQASARIASSLTTTANYSTSGRLILFAPASTIYKTAVSDVQSVAATLYRWSYTSFYATTTAMTAIRFLMSSGNILSGFIDVYGLTHA